MGGSFSNPVDEPKQQRIREIIQEVVGVFAKAFPLAYKNALIEQIKEDAKPVEEDEKYLQAAPLPDYEIKSGTLTKRGETHKSWKARHFVLNNEADNFRVDYFDGAGGTKKGSFECCGYYPDNFSSEESVEYNCEFGLKLVPRDSRRRTWYMKCASADERNDWTNAFRTACFKAKPPVNPDPLIGTAFSAAYRATRWSYGYYSWYSVTLTEAETLGVFVNDILNREILNDVYSGIAEGPTKALTIQMVKKSVDTTIAASTSAAWEAGLSSCESMKSALESAVKLAISPIFEAEEKLKVKISDKISSKVNPFLKEVGGKICSPIIKHACSPFTNIFVATVNGFFKQMKDLIENNEPSLRADKVKSTLKDCSKSVYYWYSGPLEQTNNLCYELYNGKLSDVSEFFGEGFSLYELYNTVLDMNRKLCIYAIYNFFKMVMESENNSPAEYMRILKEITGKMMHDAKLFEKEVLCSIIGTILEEPISTSVTTPCTELVGPIQSFIDELPGINEFFNLQSMLEDTIQMTVDSSVGSLVDNAFKPVAKQIEGCQDGVVCAM